MTIAAIIYGPSGSGKTSSLRNFEDGEVGLINVLGKPLPFRKKLSSVATTNYDYVKSAIGKAKARSIVVDDAGYLITDMFMSRHSNVGKGSSVYDLYNEIGDEFYNLLIYISTLDDPDKIVYVVMHDDYDEVGNSKVRTIGKILDDKVLIPGMVSVIMRSCYVDGQYCFQVNGEGICKTPIGMYDELLIPNDLKAIDTTIREYWGMKPLLEAGDRNV